MFNTLALALDRVHVTQKASDVFETPLLEMLPPQGLCLPASASPKDLDSWSQSNPVFRSFPFIEMSQMASSLMGILLFSAQVGWCRLLF